MIRNDAVKDACAVEESFLHVVGRLVEFCHILSFPFFCGFCPPLEHLLFLLFFSKKKDRLSTCLLLFTVYGIS